MERGRGKASLPGREKELEERARARRWGDCRQGGAEQKGGSRGSRKVREIHRQRRMRVEKWVPRGDPEKACRDDPCESKRQVQSEEKRREAGRLETTEQIQWHSKQETNVKRPEKRKAQSELKIQSGRTPELHTQKDDQRDE